MLQEFFEKLFSNTETKPFWQTSEFYVLVAAGVFTVINGANDTLTQLLDALAAVYGGSRGLAKAGSQPTKPQT